MRRPESARPAEAAKRLGFTYEGTFRQAVVVKGRNRDTAWFSVTDGEWQRLEPAFAAWLAPANFDALGQQRQSLSDLTAAALASMDEPRSRAPCEKDEPETGALMGL